MMLGLDAIKNVFAGEAGLWSDVRNVGMGLLNTVPFVKVRTCAHQPWLPTRTDHSAPLVRRLAAALTPALAFVCAA